MHYSDWNRMGLFPAPAEMEEEYCKRVEYLLGLSAAEILSGPMLQSADWEKSEISLLPIFDINPRWIPATYSKDALPFWMGGCAWTFERERFKIPGIQLQPSLKKSRSFSFYSLGEVLAHETIHAVRSHFPDSRFEEIFAYSTSSWRFRRFIGPIFSSEKKARFILFFCMLSTVGSVLDIFLQWQFLGAALQVLTVVVLCGFVLHSYKEQRILKRAGSHVMPCLKNHIDPLSLLVRLSDEEIVALANSTQTECRDMIIQWIKRSYRWKIFAESYFSSEMQALVVCNAEQY